MQVHCAVIVAVAAHSKVHLSLINNYGFTYRWWEATMLYGTRVFD